jgi:hypothetical protein
VLDLSNVKSGYLFGGYGEVLSFVKSNAGLTVAYAGQAGDHYRWVRLCQTCPASSLATCPVATRRYCHASNEMSDCLVLVASLSGVCVLT